jgi:tetratricopeptide (TPR) repeat protein
LTIKALPLLVGINQEQVRPLFKKFLLCWLLFGFFSWGGRVSSANNPVDSLRRLLLGTDNPKEKIHLYIQISKSLGVRHVDSAARSLSNALALARQLEDPELLGNVYFALGNVAVIRNQLDMAMTDYQLAAIYFKQADHHEGQARMDLLIGNINLVHNNLGGAIRHYSNAILLAEKDSILVLLSHLYNNMGEIYNESKDFKKALQYYYQSIKLFLRAGDSLNMAMPLENTGLIYHNLGNFELAEDYLQKALKIYLSKQDHINTAHSYAMLGMIESQRGNYEKAENYFNEGIAFTHKEINLYQGPPNALVAEILIRTGINYSLMGNTAKAKLFLSKGFETASNMKLQKLMILSAGNLSKLYEASGDLENALFFYKIYHNQSDSLSKVITVRTVTISEIKQEFEKKKKEDALRLSYEKRSKKTMLVIYLITGTVLVAILVILVLLLKLEKQRKKNSDTEKIALNEKLEFQNKELTTNVMFRNKMNEQVVNVAEKLKNLHIEEGSENAKIIRSIISELNHSTQVDTWKEFEIRFQQVHTDFYKKLADKYPDLTANELKLCAFLKLNMSTKEIAALTYQSENSIMVARTRLRQKLGISKYDNLITFFSQF